MSSQIRLRVVLPVLAVAAAGLGFVQLGGLDRLGLGPDAAEPVAAGAAAAGGESEAGTEPTPPADPAETAEEPADPGEAVAPGAAEPEEAPEAAQAPAERSRGLEALEAELDAHEVVVLVVYSPDAAVDNQVSREARLAAEDAGAGFVAVNGAKEKMVGDLALLYDLRVTPTVLVFTQGPQVATRLVGWADRQTVAEAATAAQDA